MGAGFGSPLLFSPYNLTMKPTKGKRRSRRPPGWFAVAGLADAAEKAIAELAELHTQHPKARQLDDLLLNYLRLLNAGRW